MTRSKILIQILIVVALLFATLVGYMGPWWEKPSFAPEEEPVEIMVGADTIAIIASAQQQASGASFTAIPGGESNVVLVVEAICSGGNQTTAITYAGAALTKVHAVTSSTADPGTEVTQWIKINPATGSNTISTTCAGTSRISYASFSGVDQTTGYNSAATNTCDYADSAAHACGVTTQYDSSILVGMVISATQCSSLSVQANTSKWATCGTQNYLGLHSSSARTPVGAHDLGVTTAQAGTFVVMELIPNGAVIASAPPSKVPDIIIFE